MARATSKTSKPKPLTEAEEQIARQVITDHYQARVEQGRQALAAAQADLAAAEQAEQAWTERGEITVSRPAGTDPADVDQQARVRHALLQSEVARISGDASAAFQALAWPVIDAAYSRGPSVTDEQRQQMAQARERHQLVDRWLHQYDYLPPRRYEPHQP